MPRLLVAVPGFRPEPRPSAPYAPATFRAAGIVPYPCRVLSIFFAVDVTPAFRDVCLPPAAFAI